MQRRRYKPEQPLIKRLTIILSGIALIILILNLFQPNILPKPVRVLSLTKKTNIMFLGIDEMLDINNGKGNSWKGRSDTIAVVSLNPNTNSINVLNIPRDTKIKINKSRNEKINFLNAIGGPKLTKKCLEKLLKIKIDYYVVVSLNGLGNLIDSLGGIEVDVPQKMFYKDYTAMLFIDLEPGMQTLSGKQSIQFVRFRYDSLGDIGRIQRQQQFIRAAAKKLQDPLLITKIPGLLKNYNETILTNLNASEIIKIGNFVKNVPDENRNILMLPGNFGGEGVSYWIPSKKETIDVVEKFFHEDKIIKSTEKINPNKISIFIFNATKNNKEKVYELKEILSEKGYTVFPINNYEENIKKTKIYSQKGNSEIANQIKKDIGNIGELLIGNLGPPEVDVTILAGDDIKKLNTKNNQ